MIKNGVKICASSGHHLFKNIFGPEHIMLPPKGFDIKLEGLPLDDFRNFMEYLYQKKYFIKKFMECKRL